jgi:hypothetical protein
VSGHELVGLLLAAPSPSDGQELNSVTVSPGLPGFFATFVLAVVIVLLVVDMTRRVRRVQATARVQQRYEDAERAWEQGGTADDAPHQDGAPGGEDEPEDAGETSNGDDPSPR